VAVRIVQLGSPRAKGEGLRIGTVRRPPRGVPKAEFASRDFYDVWLPDLAPSEGLVKLGQSASSEKDWVAFAKKYRSEMKRPEAERLLALLAALSLQADFTVGCYCPDEMRCHRSVLRNLLEEHGARLA
jgi:uncharacterized protein YeaO (DUF488 family)